MEQIRVKNFRCFREEQTARLAPLTLLVGENSTGKTSFLALIRALWDAAYARAIPDFKESPYDLGSFDEIAHYRGGRAGRAESFEAGLLVRHEAPDRFDYDDPFGDGVLLLVSLRGEQTDDQDGVVRQEAQNGSGERLYGVDVVFGRQGTVPVPVRWRLTCGDTWTEERINGDSSRSVECGTENGEWQWRVRIPEIFFASTGSKERLGDGALNLFNPIHPELAETSSADMEPKDGCPAFTDEDFHQLRQLTGFLRHGARAFAEQRPFASAPVRSKPRRTYDPARPLHDPEGESVPMYLSAAFFEDKRSWEALKDTLERFGRDAGLFDEITVRPLGKRGSEPFQMQVRKYGRRSKGPLRNLIDVGYGVSQALPILTELFRDSRRRAARKGRPDASRRRLPGAAPTPAGRRGSVREAGSVRRGGTWRIPIC